MYILYLVECRVELPHPLALPVVGVRPLLAPLLRRQDLGPRPALLRRRAAAALALFRGLANIVYALGKKVNI